MNVNPDIPSLHFFRETPLDMLKHPPLASSLQTFETCLFLIGIHRYPSALVSCGTAWESVIKAKLAISPKGGSTAEQLLKRIRSLAPALQAFDESKLDLFRRKRNSVVHYGFSPKDDEECVVLLLETGFPFLTLLYRELFDFFLDWRDIRPGNTDFHGLSPGEMSKAGLVPELAEHLRGAGDVYARAKHLQGLSHSYCFSGLSHYIRVGLKESAKTEAEWSVIEGADSNGARWTAEHEIKKRLEEVLDNPTWEFDCPICGGFESVVAEFDGERLDAAEVVTKRCACVQCGFVVRKGEPYLSEVLLAGQIATKTPAILREFGIKK